MFFQKQRTPEGVMPPQLGVASVGLKHGKLTKTWSGTTWPSEDRHATLHPNKNHKQCSRS